MSDLKQRRDEIDRAIREERRLAEEQKRQQEQRFQEWEREEHAEQAKRKADERDRQRQIDHNRHMTIARVKDEISACLRRINKELFSGRGRISGWTESTIRHSETTVEEIRLDSYYGVVDNSGTYPGLTETRKTTEKHRWQYDLIALTLKTSQVGAGIIVEDDQVVITIWFTDQTPGAFGDQYQVFKDWRRDKLNAWGSKHIEMKTASFQYPLDTGTYQESLHKACDALENWALDEYRQHG